MIPTWTLAVAAVAGLVVGAIIGRLIPRPGAGAGAPPLKDGGAVAEAPAETVEEAAPSPEASPAQAPRIGMEDVVSELERRYQGRRAEEQDEDDSRRRSQGNRPRPE